MSEKYKECNVCHEDKPLSEFSKDSKKADGLSYMCRTCMKQYRQHQHKNYSLAERDDLIPNEKLCPVCNQILPSSHFCKNKARHDGLDSMCKICKSDYNKSRYQKNKQKYIDAPPDLSELCCRDCGEVKPLYCFTPNPVKKNGYEAVCKTCKSKYLVTIRNNYREKNEAQGITIYERRCSNCGEIKPIAQFNKNKASADGVDHRCKQCSGKLLSDYCKTPPGRALLSRKSHNRRANVMNAGKATLTLDEWNLCLQEVGYICPMCGKPFSSERPATVDHIFPVSKGGPLTYWNTQALCGSCNSSKCDSIRIDHEIRKAQTIALRLHSFLN